MRYLCGEVAFAVEKCRCIELATQTLRVCIGATRQSIVFSSLPSSAMARDQTKDTTDTNANETKETMEKEDLSKLRELAVAMYDDKNSNHRFRMLELSDFSDIITTLPVDELPEAVGIARRPNLLQQQQQQPNGNANELGQLFSADLEQVLHNAYVTMIESQLAQLNQLRDVRDEENEIFQAIDASLDDFEPESEPDNNNDENDLFPQNPYEHNQ
ncbi:hypothetical protein RFI_35071 [Reticulomyxa filosa]|uniref:Uncharacterized protein n=1 Tax=Reticulomyxa filosa TaxID=46433 RepID=X6LNV0_RETFI|nr:hypothetical protein RFI_35071 [Reticulomyxa filosa]|eukprot:ETO02365.1 hypothetical protein RFI_35071 [Reticulomyxa filosa]